jgi:hypothetical protein
VFKSSVAQSNILCAWPWKVKPSTLLDYTQIAKCDRCVREKISGLKSLDRCFILIQLNVQYSMFLKSLLAQHVSDVTASIVSSKTEVHSHRFVVSGVFIPFSWIRIKHVTKMYGITNIKSLDRCLKNIHTVSQIS